MDVYIKVIWVDMNIDIDFVLECFLVIIVFFCLEIIYGDNMVIFGYLWNLILWKMDK